MKGKFVKDERRAYIGKFDLEGEYTILKVYDNGKYCDATDKNGNTKTGVFFNRFEPVYEVGDLVKIIKDVDGDYNSRAEVGQTTLINYVHKLHYQFPYGLKGCNYDRGAEELEIVKTKYELEEEERAKKQINTYSKNNKDNTYKKDELLRVTEGLYKNFEGKFVDYVRNMGMVLIRVDDLNVAYVPEDTVERVKKPVNNTHINETKIEHIDGVKVQVEYSGKKTTVTILGMGFSGVALCDPDTEFDEKFGKELAFLRAVAKLHEVTKKNLENELNGVQAKSRVVAERIAELIK